MKPHRRNFGALIMLALSCVPLLMARRDAYSDLKPTSVAVGTWGGVHIEMRVTAQGASIEFDCAQGTIDEPLALDAAGRFQVRGTFSRRGGPAKLGPPARGQAAIYSGSIQVDNMTLQSSPDGQKQPETFTLVRGRAGDLRRCY